MFPTTPRLSTTVLLLLLLLLATTTTITNALVPPLDMVSHTASHLLHGYQDSLVHHPLATKMLTGGTLAATGDALAQKSTGTKAVYDKRRAVSFLTFDMCYRALQHVAFPVIVAQCHGQYLGGGILLLPTDTAAALEQTLASQLGIVPFLYYPVFYTLTAFVQELTFQQATERAKTTFLPLMSKNLKFWIPVQFVQFGYLPEEWQIPFLSAAGLCWTFILSVTAGSAKNYSQQQQQQQQQALLDQDDENDKVKGDRRKARLGLRPVSS